MERSILHFDLDSFFVSVERLKNPALNGKPVIVGGDGRRGIVASCSYEARAFGVRSAMPALKAKALCPEAIFIHGNHADYSMYSKMVTDIITARAPEFEKASVDEFYVDVSGMDKFFGTYKWCSELRQTIIRESGLPVSFGLSVNKMLAKMATNDAKPNGQLMVPQEAVQAFLDPKSVYSIPMCGEKLTEYLNGRGIHTIYQLRQFSAEALESWLGKTGLFLWNRARGIDNSEVHVSWKQKSMSSERTFNDDSNNVSWLKSVIRSLGEKLAFDLRQDEKLCACVTVKIRYSDFRTVSRQRAIDFTGNTKILLNTATELFDELHEKGQPVRLIGVRYSQLKQGTHQIDMFDDTAETVQLYQAIDKMKRKYGNDSILPAEVMNMKSIRDSEQAEVLSVITKKR